MGSTETQLLTVGTLGVFFSVVARQGEIEKHLVSLLALFALANVSLVGWAPAYLGTTTTPQTLLRVLLLDGTMLTGLFGNIVLYRLFFHRLRKVPGPVGARISRFYAAHQTMKHAQMHRHVQRLHQQYGDVVRIGPREVSICRPSAIRAIYGPPTRCTKGPWYDQVTHTVAKKTMFGLRDIKLHNQRRRVWDLGVKAIHHYQGPLQEQSRLLVTKIREQHGQPMDITNWMICFAFDVMGRIVLGTDLGMLQTGQKSAELQQIDETTRYIAVAGTIPWLAPMLLQVPGLSQVLNPFRHFCHAVLDEKRKTMTKGSDPTDVISWLIQAQDKGDPSAPPTDMALKDDAWLVIVAGSDTAATALTNAVFYLATHPAAQTKLQQELDQRFPHGLPDWSYDEVKDLKYLTYVLNETLRLKPSVPDGLARVTPPQGLQVDDLHIPGDVVVSVPTFAIHRDERYFDQADQFIPERWEAIGNSANVPFIPFSRGVFDCVGKGIAWMEMRMALSMMVLEYDIRLADETQRAFDGKEMDNFVLALPALRLCGNNSARRGGSDGVQTPSFMLFPRSHRTHFFPSQSFSEYYRKYSYKSINMVLKLYGFPFSTCTRRVRIALAEKGLDAEFIPIDLTKNAQKATSYLNDLQPFGKVPVLQDTETGIQIYESRAIAQYIATKYRGQGTELAPPETDLKAFAYYQQALSIEQSYFDPLVSGIAYEKVFKERKGHGPTDEARVQALFAQLELTLEGYERVLSKQPYLAGEAVTLADLAHLPYGVFIEPFGFAEVVGKFPRVRAWWEGLKGRESWRVVTA
ncbi:cytochrome P450 [Aspergillus ibericus CBS 121593]|uniref:Cytochrome P450 n=1 Tax=Aspergillus ibericus CBS 121593 TaxID=1448316 RepID=A0A395GKI7_9EURO|nr:cytochrome P450 [Aspergillus ibericus CBS 121593]RAK95979.1 cytochrome P450 [Aspergillus ibericus CBS 121593]